MKRALALGSLVLACVLLAACGTAVPDVSGKSLVQATQMVEAAGFTVGAVSYDERANGPAGQVSSQMPAAGDRAKGGSPIALVIAGLPPVKAPSVVGLTTGDAKSAVVAAGLKLGAVSQSYDASVPVGRVISQEPTASTVVPRGTAVSVKLSEGPQPVAVPNVIGKPDDKARVLLEGIGFKVNSVREDAAANKGTVLKQEPAAGRLRLPGQQVVITVSTGVKLVRVPSCYGLPWESAQRRLRAAGLSAKVLESIDPAGPIYVGEFSIYKQSPLAGTLVRKGSLVRVWYWFHSFEPVY